MKPVPRELWNYGIRYLSGGLHTFFYDPRDAALIYLSPAAGADPVECHLLQKDWMYGHLSAEESFVLAEADKAELAAYELTEKLESVSPFPLPDPFLSL